MSRTRDEILHQPSAWRDTLATVPGMWAAIAASVDPGTISHVLLMGSGTSLYIAQSAAHAFMELTGITATAVPPSEVFLSPASTVPRQGRVLAFIISRSGTTSEALLAAAYLRQHASHVTTVGVTCNAGTKLESACDACLAMPFATERSVVMTQSFSTMLLALQIVAARMAGNEAALEEMQGLPALFDEQLEETDALARQVASARTWDTAIFLGLAGNNGLAEEGTLKLKEMTQTTCEAYNPLEFRHGPISIVDDETLIVMLETRREQDYLADMYRDLARPGARVIAIGPHETDGPDHRLVIGRDLSDLARCVLFMPFVQLLALHRAGTLGLDPDQPRNLGQVVVLNVP